MVTIVQRDHLMAVAAKTFQVAGFIVVPVTITVMYVQLRCIGDHSGTSKAMSCILVLAPTADFELICCRFFHCTMILAHGFPSESYGTVHFPKPLVIVYLIVAQRHTASGCPLFGIDLHFVLLGKRPGAKLPSSMPILAPAP
jgi:hypothetical protein